MSAKSDRLCVVSVGHVDLLLPRHIGIKVADMLEGAVLVFRDFVDLKTVWRVEREAEVEYRSVKAEQVRGARVDASSKLRVTRRCWTVRGARVDASVKRGRNGRPALAAPGADEGGQ